MQNVYVNFIYTAVLLQRIIKKNISEYKGKISTRSSRINNNRPFIVSKHAMTM